MTVRDLVRLVGEDGLDRDIDLAMTGSKGLAMSKTMTASCVDHKSRKAVCLWGRDNRMKILETQEEKKKWADINKTNKKLKDTE